MEAARATQCLPQGLLATERNSTTNLTSHASPSATDHRLLAAIFFMARITLYYARLSKTLFDALRMPKNLGETGKVAPQADESPFFCLLEDDRLITEVRVTTDRLLLLPNKPNVEPNDCFAIIRVKLNHKNARAFDNWFG